MSSFFSRTGFFGNSTQVPQPQPTIPPPKEPVITNPPVETTGTNNANNNPNANPEATPKSSRSRIPSRKEELERPNRTSSAPIIRSKTPAPDNNTVHELTVIPNPDFAMHRRPTPGPNVIPTPAPQTGQYYDRNTQFRHPASSPIIDHSNMSMIQVPHVPMHEAIAMLRKYDGTSDPKEFLEHYEIDLGLINYDIVFAIMNFDRVLQGDALSWWNGIYPTYKEKLRGRNSDCRQVWEGIKREFIQFFDQKSRVGTYKQKNRNLKLKQGDDPQSYVSAKLEICRNINPKMGDVEKIEKLNSGLPDEWQQGFALQGITSHTDFLVKLRAVTDAYNKRPAKPSVNSLNPGAPAPYVPKPTTDLDPQLQALVARIDQIEQQKSNFTNKPRNELLQNYSQQGFDSQPKQYFQQKFESQPKQYFQQRSQNKQFNNSYSQSQSNEIICAYCKKPGHNIFDCPDPGCKFNKPGFRGNSSFRPRNPRPSAPRFQTPANNNNAQVPQAQQQSTQFAQQQYPMPIYYPPPFGYPYPQMQQFYPQMFPQALVAQSTPQAQPTEKPTPKSEN